MKMLRREDVETVATPNGNSNTPLATARSGAEEVRVIRQRQEPQGFNPLHSHDHEEVMVQLSGTLTVRCEGEVLELNPGDVLVIPARTPHRLENRTDRAAEWLIVSVAGTAFFKPDGEELVPSWAA